MFLFIAPVIIYLKFKNKVNPFEFLRLNNNIFKNLLKGILFSTVFIILLVIRNKFTGRRTVNFNIGILWFSALLVGFFEEIPFRGFILQMIWTRVSFWTANGITTIIFVVIHVPLWLLSGINVGTSALTISISSLVLGYLFKEYKSLWIPIICHSIFILTKTDIYGKWGSLLLCFTLCRRAV